MNEFQKQLNSIVDQLAPESRASVRASLELLSQCEIENYDDLLKSSVKDGFPHRELACWLLARLGNKSALPAIEQCLQSQDTGLRREAARSLGIFGGEDACRHLLRRFESESDPEVRFYIAHSFGVIGSRTASDVLLSTLRNSDEAESVRAMAAESLAYIRDTEAETELVNALSDSSVEVRYWAVFALGQIGNKRVIPELEKLRSDLDSPKGHSSIADEVDEAIKNIHANYDNQERFDQP